eukprot:CAMPEP_0168174736 /NCGR_PEP_ID=MMETSP0139_2-20121125/6692_1 /TAXON_ID=44445 /ORGANISM="Pseudo-nitzschia australis, Strain 10249 10 AB" /LENGTH=120 /DNA_ID=CAMNT_0008092965 /DNA_START=289 /DNA_END=652 /DNA_ORIENTATION=-
MDSATIVDDLLVIIFDKVNDAANLGSRTPTAIQNIVLNCFVLMGICDSNAQQPPHVFHRVLSCASKQRNSGDICVNILIEWSKVYVDPSKIMNVRNFSIFAESAFPPLPPPTMATAATKN